MKTNTWGLPFELLPTTIEVTETHIVIYYSQLMGTSQTEAIPMKDVHAVEVDTDWFFGTLVIMHGTPEQKVKVEKFHKKDARELEIEIQKILDEKESV